MRRKISWIFGDRDQTQEFAGYTMYVSGEPSYLSYWAIAPIAASNSRAHSRVYEFGGTSVVVPSHSKISLNADRWSSMVRRASTFLIVCSSPFIPRTNALHRAR